MAGFHRHLNAHRSTLALLLILLAIVYVSWQAVAIEKNPNGQLSRSFSKDKPPTLLPPPSLLFNESFQDNQRLREDGNGADALHLQERALFDGIKPWILYKKYKKKGRDLRCVLEGTKATSTPWTDYGALETWGWQVTQDEESGDYSHVQEQVCALNRIQKSGTEYL